MLGERRRVPGEELPHSLLGLPQRDLAVLVDVARVDPDDVGLRPVLRALRPVEVELVLQRRVGKQRRHHDRPALLGRELVRAIAGPAEEHAELAGRRRDDGGVLEVEVLAREREALVLERGDQHLERLLVPRARLLVERNPDLGWNPTVTAAHSPLVAPAGEDVGLDDLRREDDRVVVGKRVEERPELDPARPLRRGGEQRLRIDRDRELRKREMLDHRVRVVPEPVRVDDLLEHLGEHPLGRAPRPVLDFRVDRELHATTSSATPRHGCCPERQPTLTDT